MEGRSLWCFVLLEARGLAIDALAIDALAIKALVLWLVSSLVSTGTLSDCNTDAVNDSMSSDEKLSKLID